MSSSELTSAIDALAAVRVPAPGELGDAEALTWLEQVEELGRRADALRVAATGDVAGRCGRELGPESLARKHAAPDAVVLIERRTRISAAEAARRVRLARDTAPRTTLTGEPMPARFPHVAEALSRGEISMDASLIIARTLGQAERRASIEGLDLAERNLVAEARQKSADLVAIEARVWRSALDPDGAEPRDNDLREQRSLVIGRQRTDGMTPFYGLADPLAASQLRAAKAQRTAPDAKPRFLAADDPAFDSAEPGIADPRTREQRDFDVFMGLILAGVRAEAEITTAKYGAANVMVVMTDHALETGRGTAWVSDSTEPISAASAATIACDAGFQRIALGARGEPLALGRRERFHTAAQRKAMVVRDGPGCAAMDCPAPSSWTHAHHVVPWSQGGATDVDNGVLLCPFHHRLIHDGDYEIRMFDGIPYLRAPLYVDLTGTWRRMGRPRVLIAA